MATNSSPAEAFEALRREVALLRRALEGLAAEQKAQPDYSGVLAGIGARIKEQNAALGAMAETPALQLTPEAMGQQILRASEQVRAEDARLLGHAQNAMTKAARQVMEALATARTAHAQQRAVRWSAILGIGVGAALGAAGVALIPKVTQFRVNVDSAVLELKHHLAGAQLRGHEGRTPSSIKPPISKDSFNSKHLPHLVNSAGGEIILFRFNELTQSFSHLSCTAGRFCGDDSYMHQKETGNYTVRSISRLHR